MFLSRPSRGDTTEILLRAKFKFTSEDIYAIEGGIVFTC